MTISARELLEPSELPSGTYIEDFGDYYEVFRVCNGRVHCVSSHKTRFEAGNQATRISSIRIICSNEGDAE